MRVMITLAVGALGMALKELKLQEIGGRIEIIQTPTLLKRARIPRRVLETRGDLLSLRLTLCEKLGKSQILTLLLWIMEN